MFWCKGHQGQTRAPRAADPALLSPTHSVVRSPRAINVSKGGTWHTQWAGCESQRAKAARLKGEVLARIAHIWTVHGHLHTSKKKVTSNMENIFSQPLILTLKKKKDKSKAETKLSWASHFKYGSTYSCPTYYNSHMTLTPRGGNECDDEEP